MGRAAHDHIEQFWCAIFGGSCRQSYKQHIAGRKLFADSHEHEVLPATKREILVYIGYKFCLKPYLVAGNARIVNVPV